MGLAVINHHQALVLSERQVPPSGDVPDTEWLAPAQVAPTPAAEREGVEGQITPPALPWTPQSWSKPRQAPSLLPGGGLLPTFLLGTLNLSLRNVHPPLRPFPPGFKDPEDPHRLLGLPSFSLPTLQFLPQIFLQDPLSPPRPPRSSQPQPSHLILNGSSLQRERAWVHTAPPS